MKILYIGQLGNGSTCLDRMNSLKRLGHDVIEFDASKYQSANRIIRSIQWRFQARVLLKDFNISLINFAKKLNNIDLIWVDKGVWLFPESLHDIKRNLNASAIHYTPDSQLLINKSKLFEKSLGQYDYLVTTKSFEVDGYAHKSNAKVILVNQGICLERYKDSSPKAEYKCDIGFISDYKPHYGKLISSLSRLEADIKIWGPKWKRAEMLRAIPHGLVCGSGVWGVDYVSALSSFNIGLGLLSKYIPEQHTTRSFEIPAARTFLLAERTAEHLSFFEEGLEAEFFSTTDELLDKSSFYLANESARNKIAIAGHRRCLTGGYDNDSILGKIIRDIENERR